MSVTALLSTLFFGPLELVFEMTYVMANKVLNKPGLSVIVLCLIVNLLMLPLYHRVDVIREASRTGSRKLREGLKRSALLLLELPVFLAVSGFLSNASVLSGASFGAIKDLGAPDGLIAIGDLAINLLPVLTLLLGILSAASCPKGTPLADKLLLYGTNLLFAMVLYFAPAGVVLYWMLNNLFALLRNLFRKLKCPKAILNTLLCIAGVLLMIWGYYIADTAHLKRGLLLVLAGAACMLPAFLSGGKGARWMRFLHRDAKPNWFKFLLGGCVMTVLVGLLIPSTLLAASPEAYVKIVCFHHPLWYLVSTFCLACGTFLIWMNVIYALAGSAGRVLMERLSWAAGAVMLVCYFFFGTKLGPISAELQYQELMYFHISEQLFNLLIVAVVALAVYFIAMKWSKLGSVVMLAAVLVMTGISVSNGIKIKNAVEPLAAAAVQEEEQSFQLSTQGRNVVVLTLDRAVAEYLPYIFNEKPELKQQFDGFTFYENTLSFGPDTKSSISSLYGGYEYTPVEMNRRDDVRLVDKHNEALKVLPVLFLDEGYDVTVCNPVFANYQWIPDMSVYEDYPQINTLTAQVMYRNLAKKRQAIRNNYRNFFCFSLMKTMPLTFQTVIYDNGLYNRMPGLDDETGIQTYTDLSHAEGSSWRFESNYKILSNLSRMTRIVESSDNTLLCMNNELTMAPVLLQTPDYVPAEKVDNEAYDAAHADRFSLDGKTIAMNTKDQITYYHVNMAAMLQLGDWFDYLREQGVYDNTRIILASDHSFWLFSNEDLIMDGDNKPMNLEVYNPLLMVKDFNAQGFTTSSDFMTLADVPTLVTTDLIENPVNPFTGNAINTDEKTAHDQFVLMTWDKGDYSGTTFPAAPWGSVHDDVRLPENWTFYEDKTVLAENTAP